MKKLINVDKTYNDMRIDRFLRNHFGQMPQSLIEKNLRNGKIKINKKKINNLRIDESELLKKLIDVERKKQYENFSLIYFNKIKLNSQINEL